jgi:hypothetical protein
MGAKIQNGDPYFLVLYWRAEGMKVIKDNGSG